MLFHRSFKALFLFLSLILLSVSSQVLAAELNGDINIRFLSENKRVIPFAHVDGSYIITNVKVPEIAITNVAPVAIEILSIDLEGKSNGETLIKKTFSAREVKKNMSEFGAKINKLRNDKFPMALNLAFGMVIDPKKNFAESNILNPSDIGALALWQTWWFEYTGIDRIDKLVFKVFYRGEGKLGMRTFPVTIEEYKQKNKYSFPLKGNVLIANMSTNYCHHRITNSQEFGFDALVLNEKLAINKKEPPEKLTDSYSFGQNILAAADGVVVTVADKFPDMLSEPAEMKNLKTNMLALIPKIGFNNAVGGNHLIIDHGNGEYGFYAHMREGSIRVSVGDTVKKGQVIGLLGSTGNSTGPHLHFPIFDMPALVNGNGLPVSFENIAADQLGAYRKEYNTLGNSDMLKIRIE
ncbi:MAG TPA: M23 family metallopeptidase [Candidatus Wallbacteria bacterium]|nr:M23 family metallopeptidase [Candidatus Wallbacteria bacterium]